MLRVFKLVKVSLPQRFCAHGFLKTTKRTYTNSGMKSRRDEKKGVKKGCVLVK